MLGMYSELLQVIANNTIHIENQKGGGHWNDGCQNRLRSLALKWKGQEEEEEEAEKLFEESEWCSG